MTSDGVAGGEPLTEGKWAGWMARPHPPVDSFNNAIGRAYSRAQGPSKALVAMETLIQHRNGTGRLHGGFLAAFADHAVFVALVTMGHRSHVNGATVDLSMHYLGAGTAGRDILATVEMLKETGRLFFVRLLLSQDDEPIAAATVTIRKGPSRQ